MLPPLILHEILRSVFVLSCCSGCSSAALSLSLLAFSALSSSSSFTSGCPHHPKPVIEGFVFATVGKSAVRSSQQLTHKSCPLEAGLAQFSFAFCGGSHVNLSFAGDKHFQRMPANWEGGREREEGGSPPPLRRKKKEKRCSKTRKHGPPGIEEEGRGCHQPKPQTSLRFGERGRGGGNYPPLLPKLSSPLLLSLSAAACIFTRCVTVWR